MLLYPATYTTNVGILFAALREIFPGTKSMLLKILPILVLAMLFFTFAFSQTPPIEPGVSQTLAKWRAARYSDVRYKLNLTLEKMSPVLKGTIEIRVKVGTRTPSSATLLKGKRTPSSATLLKGTRTPSSATLLNSEIPPIVLDWRKIKGFEDRSTISQVTINGKAAENGSPQAAIADEGVRVPFEEHNEHLIFRDGVVIGENVIKLDFTSPILTSGSAITRYVDKEDGAEYIYSLFVPSDASTAFPVFDQPDLKARFTLEATTPHDWQLASNTDAEVTISTDSLPAKLLKKHVFRATRPISTYVFAFATGPWSIFENVGDSSRTAAPIDRVSASSYLIYVRQSQADKFKPHAAEVFRLNREGIKYLESYFDYKFPFPKYDLVLIPEFPFGGMEHAGATFLREDRVIFPQEPTKNDHITRANLIFHEAAHQWFGDTVTMKWFDDLWLKEGFAEFMAYKTLEAVMPEYNAWKIFYERNKQAAYLTDSTKGTTPIYQEIPNLSAAKSAYGNIVYRKAPSFLKQAEFYIGPDKFQTAVRAFLKKHEFANAGWEDLVLELGGYKNSYVYEFVRPFVTAAGVPIIRFNRDTSAYHSWDDNAGNHLSMKTDAIGYTYSENFKKHRNWGMDVNLLLRYQDDD
nr:hypothetical protein [Blastocatellia bacterium]